MIEGGPIRRACAHTPPSAFFVCLPAEMITVSHAIGFSPHVRKSLDRSHRDQQHPDAVPFGIVPAFAPRPTECDPQPQTHHEVKNLDFATEQYVVPFKNHLLRGGIQSEEKWFDALLF